jgi:hypothetical protein
MWIRNFREEKKRGDVDVVGFTHGTSLNKGTNHDCIITLHKPQRGPCGRTLTQLTRVIGGYGPPLTELKAKMLLIYFRPIIFSELGFPLKVMLFLN